MILARRCSDPSHAAVCYLPLVSVAFIAAAVNTGRESEVRRGPKVRRLQPYDRHGRDELSCCNAAPKA